MLREMAYHQVMLAGDGNTGGVHTCRGERRVVADGESEGEDNRFSGGVFGGDVGEGESMKR